MADLGGDIEDGEVLDSEEGEVPDSDIEDRRPVSRGKKEVVKITDKPKLLRNIDEAKHEKSKKLKEDHHSEIKNKKSKKKRRKSKGSTKTPLPENISNSEVIEDNLGRKKSESGSDKENSKAKKSFNISESR